MPNEVQKAKRQAALFGKSKMFETTHTVVVVTNSVLLVALTYRVATMIGT